VDLSKQGPGTTPLHIGNVTVAVVLLVLVEFVALKFSFGITGMLSSALPVSLWNSLFIVLIL
jgi:hypothetical protein